MKLVAVIDLLDGRVVHARRGDRASYAPLDSALSRGGDPVCLTKSLRAMYPFHAIYVADLNAIQRRGDNDDQIKAIAAAAVDIPMWIDGGICDTAGFGRLQSIDNAIPVLGSESAGCIELVEAIGRMRRDFVLSLDFRGRDFLGPTALLHRADLWPRRVLAMNLLHVGSEAGPDLSLIRMLHDKAPSSWVFASGGVRNPADLASARAAGARGALLATSLHDGTMNEYLVRRATLATN